MSRWNRLLLLLLVYDPAPKPIQSASTWPLTLANSIAPRCFEDDIGVRELEHLLIYFGVPRCHETAISQFNQFNILIWAACKTLWIWVQFSCKHHPKKLEWHKDLVHLCSAQCVLNHPSKDFESIWKHNTWINLHIIPFMMLNLCWVKVQGQKNHTFKTVQSIKTNNALDLRGVNIWSMHASHILVCGAKKILSQFWGRAAFLFFESSFRSEYSLTEGLRPLG